MFATPSDASAGLLFAGVVLAGVLVTAGWVYREARAQAANGNPIVCSVGTLAIKTPLGWFVACALLFEFFIPVYLDSRRFARNHDSAGVRGGAVRLRPVASTAAP